MGGGVSEYGGRVIAARDAVGEDHLWSKYVLNAGSLASERAEMRDPPLLQTPRMGRALPARWLGSPAHALTPA
jgi:hypothetical protein